MHKYPSTMIANCFVHLHLEDTRKSPEFNHMALQKLCYFAYAWSVALYDDHPFEDKPIAYQYGPMFESLFFALRKHGDEELLYGVKHYYPQTEKWAYLQPSNSEEKLWHVVRQVWLRYGHFTAQQLSVAARGDGSPWETAYRKKVRQIDEDEIRTYYRAKLQPKEKGLTLVVNNEA